MYVISKWIIYTWFKKYTVRILSPLSLSSTLSPHGPQIGNHSYLFLSIFSEIAKHVQTLNF